MALPILTPKSTLSAVILSSTGSIAAVNSTVPYKIYSDPTSYLYDGNFLTGAALQVPYVYKKLGGDVLDIELTPGNVYTAYEEAVLEYSYLINIHQASNMLASTLGNTTGSFDDKGNLIASGSLLYPAGEKPKHIALKYPKFDYGTIRRAAKGVSEEIGGMESTQFSASMDIQPKQQDYDLQTIVSGSYKSLVGKRKILVKKVYYKTPHAMWRFYGYYGGLNVVGNLHNYGQFSDDSTFQLVPVWQNKSQGIAFEDAIYTRMSHFSFELKNNKLRLYPIPQVGMPTKMWIEFSVPGDAWDDDDIKVDGVNNMNTLPVGNLPFNSINSIGKQWIRRFALALCKEMLGQIRSKFGAVPIPGESLQLNGSALITEAKEEQDKLREELKTTLAELTYAKLAETDAAILENTEKALDKVPNYIFVG